MPISSPDPMFDHLLESSHRDDSNKWSNIRFCEEIRQVESIEINLTGSLINDTYRVEIYNVVKVYGIQGRPQIC